MPSNWMSEVHLMDDDDDARPESRETGDPCGGSRDGEIRLKFWGVRGSIPTPGPSTVFYGGNTSCVEMRAYGEIVVLDAGSGIRPLGDSLVKEFGGGSLNLNVLVTHTHWDHIQGFPFFAPAYNPSNHVRILGCEGARDGLRATLAGQMESPYFPIALHQMPGNLTIEELKDLRFEIGKIQVTACRANHPGICVGYRLRTEAGSVVFLPDNEIFTTTDRESPIVTPRDQLLEFLRDADLLISDAQYTEEEYRQRRGWGHSSLDEVVQLAMDAKVGRLMLFHHDPSHADLFLDHMLAHARELVRRAGSGMLVDAAREGEELVLRQEVGVRRMAQT